MKVGTVLLQASIPKKEKANLISQTGLYLMPATTGVYPELAEGTPTHLARAVPSALRGLTSVQQNRLQKPRTVLRATGASDAGARPARGWRAFTTKLNNAATIAALPTRLATVLTIPIILKPFHSPTRTPNK